LLGEELAHQASALALHGDPFREPHLAVRVLSCALRSGSASSARTRDVADAILVDWG